MSSNQNKAEIAAVRAAELETLLQMAMQRVARKLLSEVAPSSRTGAESDFLQDVSRGRRAPSATTLAQLVLLEQRAAAPFLSDELRGIELATQDVGCVYEASEAEQVADAALDMAQLLAARERTPVRLWGLVENGEQAIRAIRRMVAAARRTLNRQTVRAS